MLVEHARERVHVGALGDGRDDVARGVVDREPQAHAVRHGGHEAGVHLVLVELAEHGLPLLGVVDHGDEARTQLDVGDILGDVAAHAAVHELHPAGVAPGGNVAVIRETLDVHKDVAYYDDRHGEILPELFFCCLARR